MNSIDSCWERLVRAAAAVPPSLPSGAPFALETRVLAAWRRGPEPDRAFLPVVQRATLCACAIIVITVAMTFHSLTQPPPSELVVVDSLIQLTLMQ